jgi:hypothetical protein
VLGSLLWVGGTMGAVRRVGAWVFHPLRKAAGQDFFNLKKQTDKLFSASSKKKLFSACVSANVLNCLNKYFSYTLDEAGKQKERTCSTMASFTFHTNPKYFLFHPSHRIFRRMHEALNVGKKDN